MEKIKHIKPRLDRTGQSFGHWKVISQDVVKSDETGKVYWKVECDCGCGTVKSIRGDALIQVEVGGCNNMLSTKEKKCLKCEKNFFPKKQAKSRQYCYECVPEENYDGSTVRKRIKQWALEYKGNKCQLCGYNKCIEALELHHTNPLEKDFSISDRDIKLDWKKIKNELDKCIIICSNCHREIHNGIRDFYGNLIEGSDE